MGNPLLDLERQGQAVWLDFISRSALQDGTLANLIAADGLRGVTSNPAIFEKAIGGSADYDAALAGLVRRGDLDAKGVYEALAVEDIRAAADLLRPVFDRTRRRDGYVSLEVSPTLAHDTAGTLAEARRLWAEVQRENLMIKVPGTPAGIPAIATLIGEGINVNVTLLFAQSAYERVAEAYMTGLETHARSGGDVRKVASVASFFISRIDALVDGMLAERLKRSDDAAEQALLKGLLGRVAIANARITFQRYGELCAGPRWQALAARGAQTQRLLWASTSTKNPNYRDVLYVEELIGPDTVNTMPPATVDAFRDHGRVRPSLGEGLADARDTMRMLGEAGIAMTAVTDQLLADGVRLFADAFEKLLAATRQRIGR